jgi:hypothetical protein
MGSALVLLCAVGFTLVAAYQWAGGVGGARVAKPRVEHRSRRHPLASLVFRLGSIHAPRPFEVSRVVSRLQSLGPPNEPFEKG